MPSLQCRRILGGRNLVRVCNIVVAAIFDFMTVEVSTWRFREQIARSKKTPALRAMECPLKGLLYVTRILRRFQVNSALKSLLSAFIHTQNASIKLRRRYQTNFSPGSTLVYDSAVFRVVTQRGALRDDTKNGCVALSNHNFFLPDFFKFQSTSFLATGSNIRQETELPK